jgi:Flp pilus assembly protein TadG
MKTPRRNETGAVLLTVALFLLLMLGFMALGVEAGRWYLVRAEMSKSVDAGALAGARNLSNPYVDPKTLAHEFTVENFPTGALGTPSSGTGTASFDVQMPGDGKVQVSGKASALAIFAKMFGFDQPYLEACL